MALFEIPTKNIVTPKVTNNPKTNSNVNKQVQETKPKELKQSTSITTMPVTPKISTSKSKEPTYTKQIKTMDGWYCDNKRPPDENRPLEIYTDNKVCTGYKVSGGYITDDAYYIDTYRKDNGCIMYRYIVGCLDVNKCPTKYPNCKFCKNRK